MKKRDLPFLFLIALSFVLGTGFYAMAADDAELAWFDRVLNEFELLDEGINDRNRDQKELKDLCENVDENGKPKPFEHLHLYMYQNVKNGPRDAAIKELSKTTPYTKNELYEIILEGNVGVIAENYRTRRQVPVEGLDEYSTESYHTDLSTLQAFEEWKKQEYGTESVEADGTSPNREMTQAQVYVAYNELVEAYDEEFQFQLDNRKIVFQAMANELFFDGNKNNSAGIDILYDLDLVHIVLFGDKIFYPEYEEANGGSVNLASEEISFSGDLMPALLREQTDAFVDRQTELQLIRLASEEAQQFDPGICVEDEELREALEEFTVYEESLVDGVDPETGEPAILTSGNLPQDRQTTSAPLPSGSSQEALEAAEEIRDTFDAYSSNPLQLGRGLPCGERFCITVTPRMAKWGTTSNEHGTTGAYPENRKCVACHIAYIKEAMDTTLSKSLVPGRVTTNFFEDATCKEAGKKINLDLNIYAIPKAITLDPGDPPLTDTQEEYEEVVHQLKLLAGIINTNPTEITDKTLEKRACDSRISVLGVADLGLSTEEATELCEEAVEDINAQEEEVLESALQSLESSNNESLYTQMSAELANMLYTIEQFSRNLDSTIALLPSIQGKEYCK